MNDTQKVILASRELAKKNEQLWTLDHLIFCTLCTESAESLYNDNIKELRRIAQGNLASYSKIRGSDYTTLPNDIKKFIASLGKLTVLEILKAINTLPKFYYLSIGDVFINTSNKNMFTDVNDLGYDMTQEIRDPIIGREPETQRVIAILSKLTKNNPVLIGEAGVGKTSVVENLAEKIRRRQVPRNLQRPIFCVDTKKLVTDTSYRGELEKKVIRLMQTARDYKFYIFIDEIHTIMGAGSTDRGTSTISDLLKTELTKGDVPIIGATTPKEYKVIERDSAMERRFQPVKIEPPDPKLAVQMIDQIKNTYIKHYKIKFTPDAIVASVNLSTRYITNRNLPDKAIDVLQETCATLPLVSDELNAKFTDLQNSLELNKLLLKIYSIYGNFTWSNYIKYKHIPELYGKLDELLKNRTIDEEKIRTTISGMTGISIIQGNEKDIQKILKLEETLKTRIIGQDDAVASICRVIIKSRAGLNSQNRPIGSFLFMGPTGTGKTQLCLALSEELFGNKDNVLRLDMSEYMEFHSISKLIGAPPGYVGYGEGGRLTEYVRKHPYCVILFDESEKAHPMIWNSILGMLDSGVMVDGNGVQVNFSNTIVVLTSNISQEMLKIYFKPEFLNRLDDIVTFKPLQLEQIKVIIKGLAEELFKPLKEKNISVTLMPDAINKILNESYNIEYGARAIRRYIEREILSTFSLFILKNQIKEDTVEVSVSDGKFVYLQ